MEEESKGEPADWENLVKEEAKKEEEQPQIDTSEKEAPISKKDKRRAKKLEKFEKEKNETGGTEQFKCRKCGAVFPSKTKLFAHIRATGCAMAPK